MRDPVFTIDWDVDFDGLRNEVSEYVKDDDIKLMTKERALSMGLHYPQKIIRL